MYVLFIYFWNYAQNIFVGNCRVHLVKIPHTVCMLGKMYESVIIIL